jgi:hypothetical protein
MDVIGKYVRGFVQQWQQSQQRDAARRES